MRIVALLIVAHHFATEVQSDAASGVHHRHGYYHPHHQLRHQLRHNNRHQHGHTIERGASHTGLLEETQRVRAASAKSNPRMMVDGAFLHAPFDGRAYGFLKKPHRYIIPDRDGRNLGQMTWVEIATCCAAAPSKSHLDRDQANFHAFAPPPAQRCLSYEERFSFDHKPKTYKDDIAPKGVEKSPCPEQNPAFYKDLARDTYHPRHDACCAWTRTFLRAAWDDYPDKLSRQVLDAVNENAADSIYERARALVKAFDDWQTGVCHSPDGSPTDACCVECLTPHGNKLSRYSGMRTENMCSYFGDGWCSPRFKTDVANELLEKERRAKSLQQNPGIMTDGAFNHRPVKRMSAAGGDQGQTYSTKITLTDVKVANSQASVMRTVKENSVNVPVVADAIPYVTHSGGPMVPIPDHDGKATGQMSWVEIARCCAATPSSSMSPRDTPDPTAFAHEPAERCVDLMELRAMKLQFGNNRAPCRRENPGYFKSVDGSFRPRYKACCEYMRLFFQGASAEFTDEGSQLVLSQIKAAGDLTVYSQSLSLLTHFNQWNKQTCTDESGSATGRCCNDCVQPTINKLDQYTGLSGLKACSADAEGWCKRGQRIPVDLLRQVKAEAEAESVSRNISNTSGKVAATNESHIKDNGSANLGASNQKSVAVSLSTIDNDKEIEDQIHEIEKEDTELQSRAEGLSQKYKLTPSVNSILDRAKLTLLNEKVELGELEAKSKNKTELDLDKEENIDGELSRFQSVNKQLPDLFDNVEKFVTSGQATTLLEFNARND